MSRGLAALVVLSATAATAPARALSVDPAVEAGVALPGNWSAHPAYLQFATASADYVAYRYTDEEHGAPVPVHRVSDGAVVGALPEGATLADNAYVSTSRGDNGLISRVDVASVGSGASEWSLTIPAGQNVLATGETWVVTAPVAGGTLHLLTHAGDRTLTGVVTDSSGGCINVVGDATGVLLHCDTRVWLASVATGAVTTVTTVASPYSQIVLTTSRAFWVEAGVVSADTLHWHDRVGSGTGSVVTLRANDGDGFFAYGSGLLERVATGYNGVTESDLDPVDLSTGAAGAPVVSHVTYVESKPEGVTLAVVADSPAGRVAVVSPGIPAVRTLAELPLHAIPVTDVYYSGSRVAMSAVLGNEAQLAVAPADGSAAWSDNLDGGPNGAAAIPGVPQAMAGEAIVTQPGVPGCRLTWPGGHRDLTTQCGSGYVTLGRGGQLVQTYDDASRSYGFAAVRQAGTLLQLPWSLWYAMDGTTVWLMDPSTGVLTGDDLSGAIPSRTVATTVRCGLLGSVKVAGRWALVECAGGYSVVDLLGVVPTWQLPWQTADGTPLLGGSFVAWTQTQQSADQPSFPYLTVVATDLGPNHRSHVYGPVRDPYSALHQVAAVDDGGGPGLVYLDAALIVRRVDLGWLSQPPTTRPDTTAPVPASLTGTPRSAKGGSVTVSWSFTDPSTSVEPASGLASYDVRYRQVIGGQGEWQQPAQWQGVSAPSLSLTVAATETLCVQVRARDVAGNLSGWSADWCSTPATDSTAPRLIVTGPVLRSVGAVARFAYTASDDVGVTSYDVSVRTAANGRPLGAWRAPAAWQRMSARSASLAIAAGAEACFRVRAHDAAGNLSGWSAVRCEVRPLDDRQLRASGQVTRGSDPHATAGTVSVLVRPGSALSTRPQRGAAVVLFAIAGPGQGMVEVTAGGRVIATVHLSARTRTRIARTVHSRTPFVGAVSVRSVSARPSSIDALAVLR